MGSAADWCKAVVDEVAPQITTIPPPPLPPVLKAISNSNNSPRKVTTTSTTSSSPLITAATMAQFNRFNAQSQSTSTGPVSVQS